MPVLTASLVAVALLPLMTAQAQSTDQTSEARSGVQVVSDTVAQRVDVLIDGDLFTSYLYSDTLDVLKKPVLWPLVSASGQTVTRGYPLAPIPGEQGRSPSPHRPLAQLRRRERAGFLEQLERPQC